MSEKVGYGSPPLHSQFQPGASGNPQPRELGGPIRRPNCSVERRVRVRLTAPSSIDFYGWAITPVAWPGPSPVALAIHAWALPALFYVALVLHIGAVLKRHFGDRDASAVRRMLR